MASNSSSSSSGGIGILGLLGVVFVTLKLCHIINWSWWWVTAPFWGGFALLACVLAVIGGGALTVAAVEHLANRRKLRAFQAKARAARERIR